MNKVILIRYSEIYLKGRNRGFFERKLLHNIKETLKDIPCKLSFGQGRYLVSNFQKEDEQELVTRIQKVFGIHSFSVADSFAISEKALEDYFQTYLLPTKTFKVQTHRAYKQFALTSQEISAFIGGIILNHNEGSRVDLHTPETTVYIDVRENGIVYIFDKMIKAYSGMPVGVSGKGLALLSGGIDSPVAIFKIASRGMQIDAIHFFSYPYTSSQAKQKVLDLAKILTQYTGKMRMFMVPFTNIQEQIHAFCNEEYMITLMRRFMMRIAEKICLKNGYQAIVTGENLAQVASQTVESMTSTNSVLKTVPVFRPLIAFNKEEIVDISKQIGTYETSILPYEDCCTVFLPKNPLIKPKLASVLKEEEKLEYEILIENAVNNVEIIEV